ncbi:MAG: hemY [Ilumatobacteraceae bacterium]|nr:hemY [Ilumatobacteraceae bacterium]
MSDAGSKPQSTVVVVGGGITGLTAAYRLTKTAPDAHVVLLEAGDRLGGKIHSSPFAGIAGLDEAADAFLTRVPWAMALVKELGIDGELTSPAAASANVWWNGLHSIPEGLMLGVPTDLRKLARSKLLTWPGKIRAGLEPFLPATGVSSDSVGRIIRKRFGRQVHERLVDPLVGSIYAADTDRFSLDGVPQINDLASNNRSLLIGGRKLRAKATATTGPVFATPTGGMATLTDALAAAIRTAGVEIRTATSVATLERRADGWIVHLQGGESIEAAAVLLATPARTTAPIVADVAPSAAEALAAFEHASVVMVTLAIPAAEWPAELQGSSGYLVPKPVQRWVTAVSFASSKWAHWRPVDEHGDDLVILRISLGRDGRDLVGESDEALLAAAVSEVGRHLGITLRPVEHRLVRWPLAFPQYRPGHAKRVAAIEADLAEHAPGVLVAGASYHGIGIPACVRQGNLAGELLPGFLDSVRN